MDYDFDNPFGDDLEVYNPDGSLIERFRGSRHLDPSDLELGQIRDDATYYHADTRQGVDLNNQGYVVSAGSDTHLCRIDLDGRVYSHYGNYLGRVDEHGNVRDGRDMMVAKLAGDVDVADARVRMLVWRLLGGGMD